MGTRDIANRPWSEEVDDDSRSKASDDSLKVLVELLFHRLGTQFLYLQKKFTECMIWRLYFTFLNC